MEVLPGPTWFALYCWLIYKADLFLPFNTVYLITDNCDLVGEEVNTNPGLAHWPWVAAWWSERRLFTGPYKERTTVVFVPIGAATGLEKVHPTWVGTFVFLFPEINFAIIDSDCVPVTLFEHEELWHCRRKDIEMCTDPDMSGGLPAPTGMAAPQEISIGGHWPG